jgi:hypothetical protein
MVALVSRKTRRDFHLDIRDERVKISKYSRSLNVNDRQSQSIRQFLDSSTLTPLYYFSSLRFEAGAIL